MQIMPMRVFFAKTSRAKYISHLDVMRTFTRVLRRTKLPFWYTQGFNPHLYITFALPLSLGYEGLCESFDVKMVDFVKPDVITEELSRVLPEGFKALRTALPIKDATEIKSAQYTVNMDFAEDIDMAMLTAFLNRDKIEVMKKTKKGQNFIDIKPLVELLDFKAGSRNIQLTIKAAAGTTLNINPPLYLDEAAKFIGGKIAALDVTRTRIICENDEPFC